MKKYISYIYVILSAVCWGFIGFSNRLLTGAGVSLGNRVFIRNFGTLLVLTVVFGLFHRQVFRIRWKHLPIFLGSGLISILLLSIVYFKCQTMCSLSVAAVLLYLAPSFVVIFSAVLWKTPLTKRKVIALVVSLLGCVMVSGVLGGDTTASWTGIGLGVLSGLCYASYTVFAHYGLARYESYTMIYWTFLVAGLGSIFFADFKTLPLAFSGTQGIVGTCGVVIVATVLPYIFYTKGLEGVESGRASIITNIEPVVETLVGVFVFKEALTVWTVLGVACVFGCVILLAREGGKTAVKELYHGKEQRGKDQRHADAGAEEDTLHRPQLRPGGRHRRRVRGADAGAAAGAGVQNPGDKGRIRGILCVRHPRGGEPRPEKGGQGRWGEVRRHAAPEGTAAPDGLRPRRLLPGGHEEAVPHGVS